MIRSLLTINDKNELVISKKETSGYPAALNRVLDKVGHYAVKGINVNGTKYYIVYEYEEESIPKQKILVCKFVSTTDFINQRDITDDDYDNVLQIVRDYMNCTIVGRPKINNPNK